MVTYFKFGTIWAVLAGIATLAIMCAVGSRFLVRSGYRTLSASKATATLDRLIGEIRRRKGHGAGVLILKCGDDAWQQVVVHALHKADAVLLDVSEPSPNVLWELKQACSTLTPESVVLACRVESNERQQLPETINDMVRGAVGIDIAARLRVFYYPAKDPVSGLRTQFYRRTAKVLRTTLQPALAPRPVPWRQPETQTWSDFWRTYTLILLSLICAVFMLFAAYYGPYRDARNALEGVTASAIVSLLASLPVLWWLWLRRRRVNDFHA